MKKIRRFIWLIGAVVWLLTATGCNRDMYLLFEDGDFDGIEYNNEIMMINSELELDDMDR
ncbi:MAG: hypothetical protein IKH19_10430 [Muribaculaceae bacterium]|jgi:hypothetical protein|nr:hypothetical protein [Muribaculaceae bacterium]